MVTIWKAAAIVVLTVVLCAAIGKTEKDIAIVLITAASCGVAGLAIYTLSDVISFLWKIGESSAYQNPYIGILLKITGVAVIAEITSLVSLDGGCGSLEKAMRLLGNAMILSLSLPLLEDFASVVQEILNFV